MLLAEGLLQRVQFLPVGQAFDGLHRRAVGLDRQLGAGFDRPAVDQHGAGAAQAGFAADVGTGQAEVVAQEMHQQLPRFDLPCRYSPLTSSVIW